MAIKSQPPGTPPGPTLMGRILPGPINKRVGYGLFKKKKKKPGTSPGGQVWVSCILDPYTYIILKKKKKKP